MGSSADHPDAATGMMQALREQYGEPHELALALVRDFLDASHKEFIRRSPFVSLATVDEDGFPTVSPKGDAPGFVTIIDDHTLLLPDRPGNQKLVTLGNIVANPRVGLMFMVPGHREVLRVDGTAQISHDADLLELGRAQGRLPPSTMVFKVRRAWLHCGKAVIRSRLWDPTVQLKSGQLPTLGQIMSKERLILESAVAEVDEMIETEYKQSLY